MDFKKHLETAWHLTIKHFVPLLLLTLAMSVISFFTLGILTMVMLAGYTHALLLMIRTGRRPHLQDLFSQMHLFLPLLGFYICFMFVVILGFKMFYLPGFAVICAVTFGFLYLLPLMIDRQMNLVEGLKVSWRMAVEGNVADHIVVVILFIGLMTIGGSVFVGTLLTQPFATILVLSVYLERMGIEQGSAAPPTISDTQ